MLEKAMISGVTNTVEEGVYRVVGVQPDTLFGALADASVNVDTIIEIGGEIVFSAPKEDRPDTASVLDRVASSWSEHTDLGKVSIVGAGMKSHPGVAARTFATLAELDVAPQFISTSPIKIAFYVPHGDVERTVQRLHDVFELSLPGAQR